MTSPPISAARAGAPRSNAPRADVEPRLCAVLRADGSLVAREEGRRGGGRDERGHAEVPGRAELVRLYETMLRLRIADQRAAELAAEERIGFYLGASGREAVLAGSALALREKDWIFPGRRETVVTLARGCSLEAWADGLFGNIDDTARGRQVSGAIGHAAGRVVGPGSPTCAHVIHAAGVGWAARLRGDDTFALAYLGAHHADGQGLHDALNFAGVFDARLVVLALSRADDPPRTGVPLVARGVAYGVRGVLCDGDDVLAVWQTVRAALAAGGPTLIEARLGVRELYGAREAPSDPIERLRRHLERDHGWTDAQQQPLERAIEGGLDRALAAAAAKPPPAVGTLFDDVFAVPTWALQEQHSALLSSSVGGVGGDERGG